MAYYDEYTIDEMKNEIERLNKDLKLLDEEYENTIYKVANCLIRKNDVELLRYVLETEYFNKQDVIELLLEERKHLYNSIKRNI